MNDFLTLKGVREAFCGDLITLREIYRLSLRSLFNLVGYEVPQTLDEAIDGVFGIFLNDGGICKAKDILDITDESAASSTSCISFVEPLSDDGNTQPVKADSKLHFTRLPVPANSCDAWLDQWATPLVFFQPNICLATETPNKKDRVTWGFPRVDLHSGCDARSAPFWMAEQCRADGEPPLPEAIDQPSLTSVADVVQDALGDIVVEIAPPPQAIDQPSLTSVADLVQDALSDIVVKIAFCSIFYFLTFVWGRGSHKRAITRNGSLSAVGSYSSPGAIASTEDAEDELEVKDRRQFASDYRGPVFDRDATRTRGSGVSTPTPHAAERRSHSTGKAARHHAEPNGLSGGDCKKNSRSSRQRCDKCKTLKADYQREEADNNSSESQEKEELRSLLYKERQLTRDLRAKLKEMVLLMRGKGIMPWDDEREDLRTRIFDLEKELSELQQTNSTVGLVEIVQKPSHTMEEPKEVDTSEAEAMDRLLPRLPSAITGVQTAAIFPSASNVNVTTAPQASSLETGTTSAPFPASKSTTVLAPNQSLPSAPAPNEKLDGCMKQPTYLAEQATSSAVADSTTNLSYGISGQEGATVEKDSCEDVLAQPTDAVLAMDPARVSMTSEDTVGAEPLVTPDPTFPCWRLWQHVHQAVDLEIRNTLTCHFMGRIVADERKMVSPSFQLRFDQVQNVTQIESTLLPSSRGQHGEFSSLSSSGSEGLWYIPEWEFAIQAAENGDQDSAFECRLLEPSRTACDPHASLSLLSGFDLRMDRISQLMLIGSNFPDIDILATVLRSMENVVSLSLVRVPNIADVLNTIIEAWLLRWLEALDLQECPEATPALLFCFYQSRLCQKAVSGLIGYKWEIPDLLSCRGSPVSLGPETIATINNYVAAERRGIIDPMAEACEPLDGCVREFWMPAWNAVQPPRLATANSQAEDEQLTAQLLGFNNGLNPDAQASLFTEVVPVPPAAPTTPPSGDGVFKHFSTSPATPSLVQNNSSDKSVPIPASGSLSQPAGVVPLAEESTADPEAFASTSNAALSVPVALPSASNNNEESPAPAVDYSDGTFSLLAPYTVTRTGHDKGGVPYWMFIVSGQPDDDEDQADDEDQTKDVDQAEDADRGYDSLFQCVFTQSLSLKYLKKFEQSQPQFRLYLDEKTSVDFRGAASSLQDLSLSDDTVSPASSKILIDIPAWNLEISRTDASAQECDFECSFYYKPAPESNPAAAAHGFRLDCDKIVNLTLIGSACCDLQLLMQLLDCMKSVRVFILRGVPDVGSVLDTLVEQDLLQGLQHLQFKGCTGLDDALLAFYQGRMCKVSRFKLDGKSLTVPKLECDSITSRTKDAINEYVRALRVANTKDSRSWDWAQTAPLHKAAFANWVGDE